VVVVVLLLLNFLAAVQSNAYMCVMCLQHRLGQNYGYLRLLTTQFLPLAPVWQSSIALYASAMHLQCWRLTLLQTPFDRRITQYVLTG
jgi:hypothetical protein